VEAGRHAPAATEARLAEVEASLRRSPPEGYGSRRRQVSLAELEQRIEKFRRAYGAYRAAARRWMELGMLVEERRAEGRPAEDLVRAMRRQIEVVKEKRDRYVALNKSWATWASWRLSGVCCRVRPERSAWAGAVSDVRPDGL